MDPYAALIEIAELLERERASKFKSKAFRTAAAAIADLTPNQTATRLQSGKIAGVGDSSRAVILQAASGMIPEYLAELRARYESPTSELRALLRGDLHTHSNWSDGQRPIKEMADAGRALGHEYMALTDHSPRLKIANGLTPQRLRAQLAELDQYSTADFTLLSGIEVDILDDGALDQTPELLDEVEIVVASVHSNLRMQRPEMTRRMLAAIRNPDVLILGHCTGRLVGGERGKRPPSDFDAAAVFAACAEYGVAVEINSKPERMDPPEDLLIQAREAGCLFSVDSDAHAPGHLSLIDGGAARAEAAGIDADRIITTWSLDRLLAYRDARRRRF